MNQDQLIAQLKADEGWESRPYEDTRGYLTIGYGFLIDEKLDGELPREVGDFWLEWLVNRLIRNLNQSLPNFDRYPGQVQQALANMAYQMGVSGLLGFRQTLSFIDQGKYAEAADEALDSRWAEQTPNRARRVSDLIRTA